VVARTGIIPQVDQGGYGVRGLKGVPLRKQFAYFWTPPYRCKKAHVFKYQTLGTGFEVAIAKAGDLNKRLKALQA
jgi:hypothetical protein